MRALHTPETGTLWVEPEPPPVTRPLVAAALAALLVLAGCSGPADRTPEPIEGTASEATVGEDGLSTTGYETVVVESDRVNRTGTLDVSADVELQVDYQVRATAQRAVYRSTDGGPPSVFAVYSAPLVSPDSVAATIDPLGDRSTPDVVAIAQGVYGNVGELDHVENGSATLFGNETTLAKYATAAEADGSSVDVFVYVAAVEHEGDVVRAVAVVPRAADDPGAIRSLLSAVGH